METRKKHCGCRNVELSSVPLWMNLLQFVFIPQAFRSARKTNMDNGKLFDVHDLPETDQNNRNELWLIKTCMHKDKSSVSETASWFPCETSNLQGGDTLQLLKSSPTAEILCVCWNLKCTWVKSCHDSNCWNTLRQLRCNTWIAMVCQIHEVEITQWGTCKMQLKVKLTQTLMNAKGQGKNWSCSHNPKI